MNLPGFAGTVSILTVHKAKGLEFPVVFLPGMNQQSRSLSTGPIAIVEDGENGVNIAIKNSAGPDYQELWEREHSELLREHQRMLYVAMTRARDHLIMIGTLMSGKTLIKPNTWLGYLHASAPRPLFDRPVEAESGTISYSYPPAPTMPPKSTRIQAVSNDRQQEAAGDLDIKTIIDNLSPLPRSETLEWKSATDFIHQGEIGSLITRTGAPAVSPITRGSVLHRCLEDVTKTGTYDLDRIIMDYPDIPAMGSDIRQSFISDVRSVLNSVLGRKEFGWIFERRPDAYSELPFLCKKGRALVSGIIDRIVIRDGIGHVIDYKAIIIENDEALATWKNHYRPQIQIYCEAVKEIFRTRSVEGSLFFLDSMRLELTTKV
jgi:hypothetical protein